MKDTDIIHIDLFAGNPPQELVTISEEFRKAGFEIYLVGGAIRDIIHTNVHQHKILRDADFDFATSATPNQMMKLCSHKEYFTVPTGLKHGTVTVVLDNKHFEVTTFRVESEYSDGRHPDRVEFSDSVLEDLSRRDFTVNAMAYDVLSNQLVDPFRGMNDIEERIIRTVGNSVERFTEDGLRPIRACRIAAGLGYGIEPETFSAISKTLDVVKKVSVERVRDELLKLMKADKPSLGLEMLREAGILDLFMPELMEGYGVDQNEYHKYSVYYHNIYACDHVPSDRPLIRFAALLHDIGKPRAKNFALKVGNGNVFYNHEVISERMTKKLLRRLKFSNQEVQYITKLVQLHMFYYTEEWTDGAVRRFLRKIDGDLSFMDDLFLLRKADRLGSGMKRGEAEILKQFKRRIKKILEQENAFKVTDLDINGKDIMRHFQLKPGKIIGEILNYLLEKVMDDPELNQKEELLKLSDEYLQQNEESDSHKIESVT